MNDALALIVRRWNLDADNLPPIVELPNIGRDGLAQLFAELGYTEGVEVGVQNGDYSEVLCKANPQATIWSVDGWRHYKGYHFITTQAQQDVNKALAVERLKPYANNRILEMDSLDAAANRKPDSLGWVYIDANHDYEHVTADLQAWVPCVRSGGIVAGHDYVERTGRFAPDMQVVRALRDYLSATGIAPLFLLGRKAMLPNEVRDQPRSWMFVKP